MGRDKALIELDGRSLAERAVAACRVGGCEPVLTVGGDGPALEARGLRPVPDAHPGQGPLGGILTALATAPLDRDVFIVAVDVPGLDPAAIARVIDALAADPTADVALPLDQTGRRHHLHAAWAPGARDPLAAAFARGERAVRRAIEGLRVVDVEVGEEVSLLDVDTPADLARWRAKRGIGESER